MGGSEPGENVVEETALSRKQAKILKDREAFTQEFTIPELENQLEQAKSLELSNDFAETPHTLLASRDIGNIRGQFDVAEDQLSVSLAQRGLEGSGIEAKSLSQLAGVEASQVSDRINASTFATSQEKNILANQANQNLLAQHQVQGQALQGLLSMAPTPTGSAPNSMGMTDGKKSPLGSTVMGGAQGAQLGFQAGGPWGALAGGIVGAGTGYASAT